MPRGKSKYPTTVVGQSAIADIICAECKIGCVQQHISKWRKTVGQATNEPFPAPRPGNRYHVKDCLAWVRANILPFQSTNGKPDAVMERESVKAQMAREQLEDLQEERAIRRGQLIDRETAKQTAIGVVQRLQNLCVEQDEQELPRFCIDTLKALNVAPEIVSQFNERLIKKAQELTDRRITEFITAKVNPLEEVK